MNTCRVRAFYLPTKRFRKTMMEGATADECINAMRLQGYTDPFESLQVFDNPTERQINHLASLGVVLPPDASKHDASVKIDFIHNEDVTPDISLIEYVKQEGFTFSKYSGEKRIYDLIFENLVLRKKIEFFVFSVHRDNHDGDNFNLNDHPHYHHFENFSNNHLLDSTFVKSLDRYTGSELRFFGDSVSEIGDGGYVRGSKNTYAYKKAYGYLKDKNLVRIRDMAPVKKLKSITSPNIKLSGKYRQEEPSLFMGCLGVIGGFFVLILICFIIARFW